MEIKEKTTTGITNNFFRYLEQVQNRKHEIEKKYMGIKHDNFIEAFTNRFSGDAVEILEVGITFDTLSTIEKRINDKRQSLKDVEKFLEEVVENFKEELVDKTTRLYSKSTSSASNLKTDVEISCISEIIKKLNKYF